MDHDYLTTITFKPVDTMTIWVTFVNLYLQVQYELFVEMFPRKLYELKWSFQGG